MGNLVNWSLGMCILYGTLSFTQTINSKILYKTLGFSYYSFSFCLQRIITIIIYIVLGKAKCNFQSLKWIVPFTLSMCTVNLLSSFCITAMPLAAFASFKKMTILFVWVVGIIMRSPLKFSKIQYSCIGIITTGAILVGIENIASGQAIGYIACIFYNFSEAVSLQYSNFLSRTRQISPFDMLYFNALLSLPYYGSAMLYEHQLGDIYNYFENAPPYFYISFVLMLILGCTSELVVNFVVMKISPFYKATVSNLKDVIILFASVQYFGDFHLSVYNAIGLFLVLAASLAYSLPISLPANESQQQIERQDKSTQLQMDEQDFLRRIDDEVNQGQIISNEKSQKSVVFQKSKKTCYKINENSLKAIYDQPLNLHLLLQNIETPMNGDLNHIENGSQILQELNSLKK